MLHTRLRDKRHVEYNYNTIAYTSNISTTLDFTFGKYVHLIANGMKYILRDRVASFYLIDTLYVHFVHTKASFFSSSEAETEVCLEYCVHLQLWHTTGQCYIILLISRNQIPPSWEKFISCDFVYLNFYH